MSEYQLLINGALVDGDMTMDVINPATEEVVSSCARASKAQLDAAVDAARAAFPGWAATPIAERKALLVKAAEAIEANGAEIARVLVQEQGKPLQGAMEDVYGGAAFFRYFAGLDLPVEVLADDDARRVEAHFNPLGVVGAIIPWNFPIILMCFKLPPALLAVTTTRSWLPWSAPTAV